MISESNCIIENRLIKAKKIKQIVSHYYSNLNIEPGSTMLDIGCNVGVITREFAHNYDFIVGVDESIRLVNVSSKNNNNKNIVFLVGDGLVLPFRTESFDFIICTQVYEHTRSPQQLLREIYRVLRKGGICFFSGPNRLWFYEFHYKWVLIHWLPNILINYFFHLSYKRPYDLSLLNYWQLKNICSQFEIIDYSFYVVYHTENIEERLLSKIVLSLIPERLIKRYPFLVPNFNWILVKK